VWPAEVEAMLYAHPAIQEAVVIAGKDPRRGQSVKAIVVLKPAARSTVGEAELIHWAKENMAAYKVPSSFELEDSLPKSATGKIQWRALQDRYDQRERTRQAAAGPDPGH
jgi:acyl-coenzyme A synthetase/AMP-(fatty) acid ligase